MNKFEIEKRLTEELGEYIHLAPRGTNEFYTEEDFQELKELIISLDEKYKDVKK